MLIIRDYADQEKLVCLIITLWIVRTMRHALIELADGAVPTVANPQPVAQAPPYGDIYTALVQGNILKLQDVPSSLVEQRRPVAPPNPVPSPAGGTSWPPTPPAVGRAPAPAVGRAPAPAAGSALAPASGATL